METKEINYYEHDDNYIHLKFDDCIKAYNFTPDFREKYPTFVKAYELYWTVKGKRLKILFK